MHEPFLLADPGLLIPPAAAESEAVHRQYWLRLIEWSADRRMRLGRRSHLAVLEILGTDWPNPAPPLCPHGMKREASQALNMLLASVVTVPSGHAASGRVDTTQPPYVRDARIDSAIKADIAEQHDLGLAGTGTSAEHWAQDAAHAEILPGPPTELALITAPGAASERERDLRVAWRLVDYRLTIVGGLAKETVYKDLKRKFEVDSTAVRWIETEKSAEPPLNRLKGMQPGSDIVFCVTGWLGHAESHKVVKLTRKCGVKCVCVEKRSEIVDELRRHLGE